MASAFDPYHNGTDPTAGGSGIAHHSTLALTAASSSGILSLPKATREPPIFSLSRMNIKLNHDIEQLAVNNHAMVVLMANVLHRISLRAAHDPIDRLPELPPGVRIVRMFLDPLGSHLLLTVRMPPVSAAAAGLPVGATGGGAVTHELWYLHRTSREPKRCERYRGHEITAVGWNRTGGAADAMTGAILLGTSRGVIFETELSCAPGEKRGGTSVNWKQVFDVGKGDHCPITGLEFHKMPNSGRHIVMVATPTRLYTFQEELRVEERHPYLHNIFASYLNKTEQQFIEVGLTGTPAASDIAPVNSALRFIYDTPNATHPRFYAWLNAAGVQIGDIDASAESPEFHGAGARKTIPFPEATGGGAFSGGRQPAAPTDRRPIAFELTDYHVLLLYIDRIVAVARLSHATVYEEYFDVSSAGTLLGLARDQRASVPYLFSRKEIIRVRVRDEQRHVWRQYLELGDFVQAQKSTHHAANLNLILIREADVCFTRGDYGRAARLYAESRACFETVCLKFLRAAGGTDDKLAKVAAGGDTTTALPPPPARSALMMFVRQRLDKLKSADQSQITMLVVWLVKWYVMEMAAARSAHPDRRRALQADFDAFVALPRVAELVHAHPAVFYRLLATHGDTQNLSALRAAQQDYGAVIEQHMECGAYAEALDVLRGLSGGGAGDAELFYRHAPVLMEELPKQTAEVLRSTERRLNAERLLPALMCVETTAQRDEVVRFLQWSIHTMRCDSEALHNYLIQLYAQWKPDRLMNYLNNEGADVQEVHYDVQFALRCCLQHERIEPSVFLYGLLELWQPAVELALLHGQPLLAEQTAGRTADAAVRRQLWLHIAKHRIAGCDDVRAALQVLHKCDGLLRIEDVLPYFNDFDRIDHFKEAVIDALRDANEVVQRHCEEMDESAKAAELVRDELQTFRQRSVRIGTQQQCAVCRTLLLVRPFFMFQCGHMFHADCMEVEVAKQLGPEDTVRLGMLHMRMAVAPVSSIAETAGGELSDRDRAKLEYEELISAECLLCGNYMIESIDRPFGGGGQLDDWA